MRDVVPKRLRNVLLHCFAAALVAILSLRTAFAHPMPNSLILLDIQEHHITAELQLPLTELALAFGKPLAEQSAVVLSTHSTEFTIYLREHIHPTSSNGAVWSVVVDSLYLDSSQNAINGTYHELRVHLTMTPPTASLVSDMRLHYDVILHQVVTHSALVAIRKDWQSGLIDTEPLQVGIIAWDIRSNTLAPFVLEHQRGNAWQGVQRMIVLGMQHIAEGADHLLFLLVLLLPAPLLVENKLWRGFGGVKYSFVRIIKIVSAFTIGHSLTLIIGALGWLRLPSQPVEVVIAFSILVSAIHAIVPLFAGKEMIIATGFGLVHGLAFANSLTNLHLSAMQTALSIAGFNAGIEIAQLGITALIMPMLLIWSRFQSYSWLRISVALLAGILACIWAIERILNHSNTISTLLKMYFKILLK